MTPLQKLQDYASKPPFVIGVGDANNSPYMIRWTILRFRGWSLRFHVFLRSDPDAPHDHPWAFWSLVLAGSYTEENHDKEGKITLLPRKVGSFAHRRAEHRHRVILPSDPRNNLPAPCLTLILTAPTSRDWGFWCSKDKFLPWKNVINNSEKC